MPGTEMKWILCRISAAIQILDMKPEIQGNAKKDLQGGAK
jgi:hypothetical protein